MRNPERAVRRADEQLSRGVELTRAGAHARAEGALRSAVRQYRRVLDKAGGQFVVTDELHARSTGGTSTRWNLAVALWRLANVVAARGDVAEATGHCAEAAELMRFSADAASASTLDSRADATRLGLAVCLTDLSLFRCASGALPDEAIRNADEAVGLLSESREGRGSALFLSPHPRKDSEQALATAYHALARAHIEADEPRHADVAIRLALQLREPAADTDPGATVASYELASSLLLRARILLTASGTDHPRAAAALDRASTLLDTLGAAGAPLRPQLARLHEQLNR